MTDSIERQIAHLNLPEPTPDLDRRIAELLQTQRAELPVECRRGNSVMALAGGTLAAGVLGLLLCGPPSQTLEDDQTAEMRTTAPVVETVEVTVPELNLTAPVRGNEQDRILSPESIVISTSVETGDTK